MDCPLCGRSLLRVRCPAYLNEDQFDSIKAGDYYCDACPKEFGNGHGTTGFAYFWRSDIEAASEPTDGEAPEERGDARLDEASETIECLKAQLVDELAAHEDTEKELRAKLGAERKAKNEARRAAGGVRAEAGWEKSWPFDWEPEPTDGEAE